MEPRASAPQPAVTIAGYPTRRLTVRLEETAIPLLVVKRLEDYVDTQALLSDADAPEPPYWAHLWAGSLSLARVIGAVECVGRRVADLGCGVGLAGIVAARRGAVVTLADLSSDALHFARANAELNGCRAGVVQTDLRRPGLRGPFDYCLAADATYDPHLQVAVAAFLAAHLAAGGRAWCAESVRTLDAGFRHACEERGLHVTERDVREIDDGCPTPVRITEVSRAARLRAATEK